MQVSAMEAMTGTANSLRSARPISAVTVAMEPGPARSGMARGKMATSSFSAPSCVSSGVTLVRCCWARSISMEVSSKSTPPATLKAPSVMPNTLKISVPARAKVLRMKKVATLARLAISRRLRGGSPRVMAMKTGMAPIGSTTKKIAESDSRLKLSHSIMRPRLPAVRTSAPWHGSRGCSRSRCLYHRLLSGAPSRGYHPAGGGSELSRAGGERQRHHLRARPGGAVHLGEPGLRARHRVHPRRDAAAEDLGPGGARVPERDGEEPLRGDADRRSGGAGQGRPARPAGAEEPARLPRADAGRRAGDRPRHHRAEAGGRGDARERGAVRARGPGQQRRALGLGPAGEPHLPLRALEGAGRGQGFGAGGRPRRVVRAGPPRRPGTSLRRSGG